MSDYRRVKLVFEVIELLHNVTTGNYEYYAIANSHTLQFTTACTKSF
jgi:hypothetical protein